MKKIICILLTLLVLCGCSKFTVEDIDWENEIEGVAYIYVMTNYSLSYDVKSAMPTVTTVKEVGNNKYEVYGTVRCTDNYGTAYEAKWNGVAYVDLDVAQGLIDEGAKKDDSFHNAVDFDLLEAGVPRR